jgi:hypothetical protein
MNREILFRGKSNMCGKWIYGFYTKAALDNSEKIRYQMDDYTWIDETIIPVTVGQFTGLSDRNGNEIYEGDVVFILSTGRKCLVLYRDKAASFALYGNGRILLNEAYWFETDVKNSEVEIIGNVHDNPELLKNK